MDQLSLRSPVDVVVRAKTDFSKVSLPRGDGLGNVHVVDWNSAGLEVSIQKKVVDGREDVARHVGDGQIRRIEHKSWISVVLGDFVDGKIGDSCPE